MKKFTLLLLLVAPWAAAQDIATKFQSEEVVPGIYSLSGVDGFGGGGVGLLIGDEYVVLIDDALYPTGAALLAEVKRIAGRPADFVINTHVHGDHVGSNELMASEGAVIVAHDNIRKRMKDDEQLNSGPGALPVITFNDQVTFHINGMEAFVFHVERAHTDGDAAILFREANVIAPGDIVFRGLFPFIDLDNGGTVSGFMNALQTLIDLADDETKFISGHGPVATRDGLLAMLKDSTTRVKSLIDKGMTEEDIVAANPLSMYHDDYNWGFITTERMTRTLIRSLTTD
jgi:glyoxylase-like metal-dependent hydrolase (beta-lactamase superfamily II)